MGEWNDSVASQRWPSFLGHVLYTVFGNLDFLYICGLNVIWKNCLMLNSNDLL